MAQALVTLSTRHARLPIVAIGHSHGGSVIEHALRHLPSELSIVPILLATPDLQYDEKLVDRPNAHLTALLYAGAVAIPAVLSLLAGWALALLGSPGLNIWNDQWLLPAGILVVALVFALRPAVRRAREALCAKQPKPRHKARRIWCHGDEVFYMFARADAVRNASETLRVAVIERLERLQDEPWVRMILFELAACALCWGFMAASVRELARTDPAMLHPLIQQPGVLRDASILLAAMLLKLIVYGRPRVYRALASMTSLVLFAMNAGLAQLCRVSLAGLSFTEGILVEVQTRLPIHDGVNQIEVASSALPDWKMGVHSATLGDVAVLQALQEIVSAIAVD